MKFVMDERFKHRLTGVIVIVSIAAIFLPAVMKKSNHHFEENVSLSVKLPAKPTPPKVAITDQKNLFQSVKVAHADVPVVVVAPRAAQIAKAEPLNIKSVVPAASLASKTTPSPKAKLIETAAVKAAAATPKKLAKSVELKKEMYAVQIASFSQKDNAQSLVTRLRSKGYIASYNKFIGKQGEYYKVVVGQLNQEHEAKNLQKKLATSMQLQGFVVKTGVS